MIAILSLLAAAASEPTLTPFKNCVRHALPELEISGEAPDDVAKAVRQTCKDRFQDQIVQMGATDAILERSMSLAQKTITPDIATHVVRMRACKKTPRCIVRSLWWEYGL